MSWKPRWYENLHRDWQEVVDQSLHFAAGFILSGVIGSLVPEFVGVLTSIVIAIIREIIQNWGDEDNDYLDMAFDLTVWSMGAVVASLVF